MVSVYRACMSHLRFGVAGLKRRNMSYKPVPPSYVGNWVYEAHIVSEGVSQKLHCP